MFLVRIIANIWHVINQKHWHRSLEFPRLSEHPGESLCHLRFIHCLSCFLCIPCFLYSCSALLCRIIPRVLHFDWVTPTNSAQKTQTTCVYTHGGISGTLCVLPILQILAEWSVWWLAWSTGPRRLGRRWQIRFFKNHRYIHIIPLCAWTIGWHFLILSYSNLFCILQVFFLRDCCLMKVLEGQWKWLAVTTVNMTRI